MGSEIYKSCILTIQLRRLGTRKKSEDGVNPRLAELKACEHITQAAGISAVIGKICQIGGGFCLKGEMNKG